MKSLSSKLGLGACALSVAAFAVFTACFIAILFVNEPFSWNGFEDFAAHEAGSQTAFKYIAMASMIVFACSYVVLIICIGDTISPEKKPLCCISAFFALAFCIAICINYFVQLTATRLQLKNGLTDGLVQLTQSFNISAINAVNMLGWTLFYAISTLFLAFLFDSGRLDRIIKGFCLANTAMMLLGLVGYMINNYLILALSMNLGLGVTTLGIIIPAAIRFNRQVA